MFRISMLALFSVCLFVGSVRAEEPQYIEIQGVVWRGVASKIPNHERCDILVMNVSSQPIELSRFPYAFNTQISVNQWETKAVHYDGFSSVYPRDFDKIEPGDVRLFRLSIQKISDAADNPVDFEFSLSVDVYVNGKRHQCAPSCVIRPVKVKKGEKEAP